MAQAPVNSRQDPVKKTVDRLLLNAAIAEAKRIEKSVPLPAYEAKQLADAIIIAGTNGIILRLADVLGQRGGKLVALLEIVTHKSTQTKSVARKLFIGLMKKKGRWRQLGNTSLTFATKVKVSGMENLPFATPEFLKLYDLKSEKLKYSAEVFLFGAVEKLSENDDDDSENESEKATAKAHEAKIRRIFKIIGKSQPDAGRKENTIDPKDTWQKIREKLQPLFDFNDRFEHVVAGLEIFEQVDKLLPEYEAALEGVRSNLLKEVVDGNLPWRKAVKRAERFGELLGAKDKAITDFFRTAIFKNISGQIDDLGEVLRDTKKELVPSLSKKGEQPNSKRAQKSQTKYQNALKEKTKEIFQKSLSGFGDVDGYVKKFAKYGGEAAKHLGKISLAYDIIELVTAPTVKQTVVKTVEIGLSLAGTTAGAQLGAAIGAFGGPAGIFIGGLLGGLLGSFLGEAFAKDIVAFGEELASSIASLIQPYIDSFVVSYLNDLKYKFYSSSYIG